jgi:hypothetical protein
VSFANIKAKVNVVAVKGETASVGVSKGALMGEVPVVVTKNDAGTTVHAMKKRCDFQPAAPDIEEFLAGHKIVMAKVPVLPTIQVDEDMFAEYLAQYSPAKAARLADALSRDQLNYNGERSHVFAKSEVLLKEHGSQARVIYQQDDMHNALAGVISWQLNKRMKTVFAKENPLNTGNVLLYACGLKNEEIGALIEADPGQVVENDMKNNDASQVKQFRRSEAMLYAKMGAPKWFVREFAANLDVQVWTRYGIAATVSGQMWSGRNNTTSGNSYVGMCLIARSLEVAEIETSTNIHGGDDYLGIVPVGKENDFQRAVEKVVPAAGMTPEFVVPTTREHATFYRKRYVRTIHRTRGVPMFGRVLSKLNLRANMNQQVDDRKYMAGKYLSAAYEHRFVPRIAQYLLQVSQQMSIEPHMDTNTNREVGHMGVEKISELILGVKPLNESDFGDFLHNVYNVTLDELVEAYQQIGDSCVNYLNGWTTVVRGKVTAKPGFVPSFIRGSVASALVRTDLGY